MCTSVYLLCCFVRINLMTMVVVICCVEFKLLWKKYIRRTLTKLITCGWCLFLVFYRTCLFIVEFTENPGNCCYSLKCRYDTRHCKAFQKELDSLHWFFQRRIPTPHFGGKHQRGLRPQIRTRSRFLYNAPIPKFHHPMSTRSEVIVLKSTHKQSNKQTPLKISNAFCYIDVKTFLLFYFGHFLRSWTFLKIFLRVFYF